jgi:type I restriction enzyme S subunit
LEDSIFENFKTPFPPLEIQQKIVEILDKFTLLEAELEAELEARRKQYEYYRDKLLKFPDEGGVMIKDMIDYIQPTKYIVFSTKYNNEYSIPVLTAGKSLYLGYTNETNNIYKASKDKPVIIFDDFTCNFHWVDFEFKIKSSAMKILIPRNVTKYDFKFLFYLMKTLKYDIGRGDHKRH